MLRPMLTTGQEPVGAMGDDTPVAAMSKLPRPLFSYFKQRFAEVTNPPIDPLREELVMSTRMLLGRRGQPALRDACSDAPHRPQVADPAAEPGRRPAGATRLHLQVRDRRRALAGAHGRRMWTLRLPALPCARPWTKLCRDAEAAVRDGAAILIVSDEAADVHSCRFLRCWPSGQCTTT